MSTINLNRVVLTGRVIGGPDLETLPSGVAACSLEMEVTRRRQIPGAGGWGDQTSYVEVVAFGSYAETTAEHLRPGREVGVDGWLEVTRKSRGSGGVHARVIADTIQFLDSRADADHRRSAQQVLSLVTA